MTYKSNDAEKFLDLSQYILYVSISVTLFGAESSLTDVSDLSGCDDQEKNASVSGRHNTGIIAAQISSRFTRVL